MAIAITALVLLPAPSAGQEDPVDRGRYLFEASCASCHGAEGAGSELGPSLTDAGAASADFYLRTGRMPLPAPDAPTLRRRPAFDDEEIKALVAYVASLGDGPEIPDVDPSSGDVSSGSELFANSCAACHGATGNGGAVGANAFAPTLFRATPLEIAEAMVVGPGQMPRFSFDEGESNDIVAYIQRLKTEDDPGGLDIGGVGPVPEGYVAWMIAMLALLAIVLLIGRPTRDED